MAEPIYEELGLVRIQRWQGKELGRAELAGATLAVAAGVQDSTGVGLQLAFERTEGTDGNYEAAGAHRAIYARRRCSGARRSPAMADGGFGRSRGSGYRARARERGEGKGREAHGGLAEQHSGVGGEPVTANRRRRRPASEKEEDEAVGDAGRPSAWGQVGAKRRSMAGLRGM